VVNLRAGTCGLVLLAVVHSHAGGAPIVRPADKTEIGKGVVATTGSNPTCIAMEKQPVSAPLDLGARMQPVPRGAVFQDEGWFTWGGSMVRGNDGRYYLCYSRWPYEAQMKGWITHSQIACAVADDPLGPYRFSHKLLEGRGDGFFDATMVHNPHIHKFGDTYYLYYIGATAQPSFEATRRTQRIGVATAQSIHGPWTRLDRPLLDVSDDSFDSRFTTNPSVVKHGGRYVMLYKCLGEDKKVFHGVAFSDSPTGPFSKHGAPIFTHETHPFPAEDPFIFSYQGKLHAILSDHAVFTGIKQALCLFTSENGIDWEPAEHPLISDRTVTWGDGTQERLADLERPQIYFDEDGEPRVLFCAATREKRAPGNTFNIHIPLAE
jgi:hypothetical protein